jgi:hypothetical protein
MLIIGLIAILAFESSCSSPNTATTGDFPIPAIVEIPLKKPDIFKDSIIEPIILTKLLTTDTQIRTWFINSFYTDKSISVKDLSLKKLKSDYLLDSKQKSDVYTLNFIGTDYPSGWKRDFILMILKDKKQIFVLEMDNFIPVFIKKTDNFHFFGGIYSVRDHAFFVIYKYDNQHIARIFDTGENQNNVCNNGLRVGYYRDDACVVYQPNNFVFSQKDTNKDGYADVLFSGKIINFCEGAESRNSNIPLSHQDINIVFEYNPALQNWFLKDKTRCNILNFME